MVKKEINPLLQDLFVKAKVDDKIIPWLDRSKLDYSQNLAIDKEKWTDWVNTFPKQFNTDENIEKEKNKKMEIFNTKTANQTSQENLDKAKKINEKNAEYRAKEKLKKEEFWNTIWKGFDDFWLWTWRWKDKANQEIQANVWTQWVASVEESNKNRAAAIWDITSFLDAKEDWKTDINDLLTPLQTNQEIKDNSFTIKLGGENYTTEQLKIKMNKMNPEQLTAVSWEVRKQLREQQLATEKIEAKNSPASKFLYNQINANTVKEQDYNLLLAPDWQILWIDEIWTKTKEQLNREIVAKMALQANSLKLMGVVDKLWTDAEDSDKGNSDAVIMGSRDYILKIQDKLKRKILSLSDEEINNLIKDNWLQTEKIKEILDDQSIRWNIRELDEYIRLQKMNTGNNIYDDKSTNPVSTLYQWALNVVNQLDILSADTVWDFLDRKTNWLIGNQLWNETLFWIRESISEVPVEEKIAKNIGHAVAGMGAQDIATIVAAIYTFWWSLLTKAPRAVAWAAEVTNIVSKASKLSNISKRFAFIDELYNTTKVLWNSNKMTRWVVSWLKEAIREMPFNILTDAYDPSWATIAMWPGLDFVGWFIWWSVRRYDDIEKFIDNFDYLDEAAKTKKITTYFENIWKKEAKTMTKEDVIDAYRKVIPVMSEWNTSSLWILWVISHIKQWKVKEIDVRQLVSWLKNLAKNSWDVWLSFVAKNTLAFMKPVTNTLAKIDKYREAGKVDNFDELLTKSYQEFVSKYDDNFLNKVVWKRLNAKIYAENFNIRKEAIRTVFEKQWFKPNEEQLSMIANSFTLWDSSAKFAIWNLMGGNYKQTDIDKTLSDISQVIEERKMLWDNSYIEKVYEEWGDIDSNALMNQVAWDIEKAGDDIEQWMSLLSDMIASNKSNPSVLLKFWDEVSTIDQNSYNWIASFLWKWPFWKLLNKAIKFSNSLTWWKKLGDLQKWINDMIEYSLDFAIWSKYDIDDIIPKMIWWKELSLIRKKEIILTMFWDLLSYDTNILVNKIRKNSDIVTAWNAIKKDVFLSFVSKDITQQAEVIANIKKSFIWNWTTWVQPVIDYLAGINEVSKWLKHLIASSISKSNVVPDKLLRIVEWLINKTILEKELLKAKKVNWISNNLEFDSILFKNVASLILQDLSVTTKADDVLSLIMNWDSAAKYLWSNRVQSARETVMNVYQSIMEWTKIDIHNIYYTQHWRKILNDYMQAKLTPSQYKEYVTKYMQSHADYIARESDNLSSLLVFYDKSTGKLNTKIEGSWWFISLGDFLLGKQVSYTSNGIIKNPLIGMFKMLSSGKKELNWEFLLDFFKKSIWSITPETQWQKLVKDLSDQWISWYNIYDRMKQQAIDILSKRNDVVGVEALVIDMLDPMLYSHKQYFDSLPDDFDINSIEKLESLLFNMLNLHWWKNSVYMNAVIDKLPAKIWTKLTKQWYNLKNIDYTDTARELSDYLRTSDTASLDINEGAFADYVYKYFADWLISVSPWANRVASYTAKVAIRDIAKMEWVDIWDEMVQLMLDPNKEDLLKITQSIRSKLKTPIAQSSIDYLEQKAIDDEKIPFTTVASDLLSLFMQNRNTREFVSDITLQEADIFREHFDSMIKDDVWAILKRINNEEEYIEWWMESRDKIFSWIKKRIKDMERKYWEIIKEEDFDVSFWWFTKRNEQFFNFVNNVANWKTSVITYNLMRNKWYSKNIINEANKLADAMYLKSAEKYFRIDGSGNVVLSVNENLNKVRKIFLNLNPFWWIMARDPELTGITQEAISKQQKGKTTMWKIQSISKFQEEVTSKYIDIIWEGWKFISKEEHRAVITSLIANRQSLNFDYGTFTKQQKDLYTLLRDEVIKPLNDYRKNNQLWEINKVDRITWQADLKLDYFIDNVWYTYLWNSRYNPLITINQLFWHSMFMRTDDINRISNKYKTNVSNFVRDFMLNWANDWSLLDKAISQIWSIKEKAINKSWKATWKAAVALAFSPLKWLPNFMQQTMQTLFYATGIKKSHKVDWNLLSTIEDILSKSEMPKSLFQNFLDFSNYITASDRVAAKDLHEAIIAQSLYMVSEWKGNQYAEYFIDSYQNAEKFMKKFWIKNIESFSSNYALAIMKSNIKEETAKIDDLIQKWEWDIDALIEERRKISTNYYTNEFNKIKEFVWEYTQFKWFYDASVASNFVISKVKTMTEIPFLNANRISKNSPRFLFWLMKWSMSTTGRWGTKILDEVYKYGNGGIVSGVEGLIRAIKLWEAKEAQMLFSEMAIMTVSAIKANDQAWRVSWDKYHIYDVIVQPRSALNMLLWGIRKWYKKAKWLYDVSMSDDKVTGEEWAGILSAWATTVATDFLQKIALIEYLWAKELVEAIATWVTTQSKIKIVESLYKDLFLWSLYKIWWFKASWFNYAYSQNDWSMFMKALLNTEWEKQKNDRKMSEMQYIAWLHTKLHTKPWGFYKDIFWMNWWSIWLINSLFNRNLSTMADQNILNDSFMQYKDDSWVTSLISEFSSNADALTSMEKYNSNAFLAAFKWENPPEWMSISEFALRKTNKFEPPIYRAIVDVLDPEATNIWTERNMTFDITNKVELKKIFDAWVAWYWEGKVVDKEWKMFKRFVSDVQRMWTNTTLWEVMKMYVKNIGDRKLDSLVASWAITKGERSAFIKWWWELKPVLQEYLEDMYDVQMNLVVETRPIRWKEFSVKNKLSTTMIANDPWAETFMKTWVGQLENNISLRNYSQEIIEHWRLNGVFDVWWPTWFFFLRAINSINQVNEWKTEEEKALAKTATIWLFDTLGNIIKTVEEDEYSIWRVTLAKVWLATLWLPLLANISWKWYDDEYNKLLSSIDSTTVNWTTQWWNIRDAISVFTNSSPIDMQSALDAATWEASDKPWKWKWGSSSISTKLDNKKIDIFKAQLDKYNQLVTMWAKAFNLPWKYTYDIIQEWNYRKIKASPIKLPEVRNVPAVRNNWSTGWGANWKPRKFGVIKWRVLSRWGRIVKWKSTKITSI